MPLGRASLVLPVPGGPLHEPETHKPRPPPQIHESPDMTRKDRFVIHLVESGDSWCGSCFDVLLKIEAVAGLNLAIPILRHAGFSRVVRPVANGGNDLLNDGFSATPFQLG